MRRYLVVALLFVASIAFAQGVAKDSQGPLQFATSADGKFSIRWTYDDLGRIKMLEVLRPSPEVDTKIEYLYNDWPNQPPATVPHRMLTQNKYTKGRKKPDGFEGWLHFIGSDEAPFFASKPVTFDGCCYTLDAQHRPRMTFNPLDGEPAGENAYANTTDEYPVVFRVYYQEQARMSPVYPFTDEDRAHVESIKAMIPKDREMTWEDFGKLMAKMMDDFNDAIKKNWKEWGEQQQQAKQPGH